MTATQQPNIRNTKKQAERVRVQRQPAGNWLLTVDGVPLAILTSDQARPAMLGKLTADQLILLYGSNPAGL